ncbi:MAG: hypothetical protein WD992_02490 [Candidatus Levyibacteriota bacterium]
MSPRERPAGENIGNSAPPVSIAEIYFTPYTDVSGVPLSSDRGRPDLVKGIDFEYQSNRFRASPSRHPGGSPHKIPVSGLEQRRLSESYSTMLGIVRAVRDAYLERTRSSGSDVQGPLNTAEALDVLTGMQFLPHYLRFRSRNPLPVQDTIPKEIVVLSNAASGSRGAIGALIDLYKNEPDLLAKIPDINEMVDEIERLGRMVGEKTVCAASPAQIRHFLGAVLNGPPEQFEKSDIVGGLLDEQEVLSLVAFGQAVYFGIIMMEELKELDAATMEYANKRLQEPHPAKDIRKALEDYLSACEERVINIEVQQIRVGALLGREVGHVTLESLAPRLGLKIPGTIGNLRPEFRPRPNRDTKPPTIYL